MKLIGRSRASGASSTSSILLARCGSGGPPDDMAAGVAWTKSGGVSSGGRVGGSLRLGVDTTCLARPGP